MSTRVNSVVLRGAACFLASVALASIFCAAHLRAAPSTPVSFRAEARSSNTELFRSSVPGMILIGALGSLAFFCAQQAFRVGRRALHDRAFKAFWQFKQDTVTIIHPVHHDNAGHPVAEELARVEVITAVIWLVSFFRGRGRRCRVQSDAQSIPTDSDIVFVSSPKGNRRSAAIATHLRLPFEYKQTPTGFCYHDRITLVDYESPRDRGQLDADIGLVSRITAPTGDRNFYLLWGIHILGTMAAAKFVVDPSHLRTVMGVAKHGDLAVLVQATAQGEFEISDPQLVAGPHVVT